ncbi:MAG: PSD1 and planctomycete cytochrome C domain-containing protein, partial [Planctomycetota bacterium]
MMTHIPPFIRLSAFTLLSSCSLSLSAADSIVFNRDIRPILSDKCFHCHGPGEGDQKGDLRLDRLDGPLGAGASRDGYAIIKPGDPEDSELWWRVTDTDPDERMPPAKSRKKPLTSEEQAIIKQWITEGGTYQDFWAFIPPSKTPLPAIENESWVINDIDHRVAASLQQKELTPKPAADKRTLIRRLTFDLTGLPPSLQEIEDFLSDKQPGAYARLVDRLLDSPAYGEHMARYWADLVRLGDTNGMHKDFHREFSPYRDWIIRSFNDNLPFDDFIKYQVAGDLYPEPTRDQLVASGFNRLHMIIDRGTALPEESLHKNILDRIEAFGTTFLGLTVQCAQCHDHKYDPMTRQDYYQLYAFFNNFSGAPETTGAPARGLQPPFIYLSTPEQDKRLAKFDAELKRLADDPSEEIKKQRGKIEAQRKAFTNTIPAAMVMKEREPARQAFFLIGGAYDAPGDPVERNTPAFLPPMPPKEQGYTRMDLANWLVAPNHPLTARVAVNRFWQQLFGVGLVKTAEDFGAQGEWPSHPQLLDDLALRFSRSGWDVKQLIRHIVMSNTYRQSSDARPEDYDADPENRELARGSRYRMDAEMIRDQILAISGQLNTQMFGPSVKPPQPPGLWEMVSMAKPFTYVADTDDQIYRRSLYTYWRRGMPPPQMTILNAPSREFCVARRERTNTPLQALLLMNEQEYFNAAKQTAKTLLEQDSPTRKKLKTL